MYDPLESSSKQNLPSKSKFARTFRILSRVSYWIHVILGTISAVILILVIFSSRFTFDFGTAKCTGGALFRKR